WKFESAAYGCVVTHSLLHFLFDPLEVCEAIHGLVTPRGMYVMANEPNSRFWANPVCVRELRRVDGLESRGGRLRRYVDPLRDWSRLVRTVRPETATNTIAGINRMLRERFGLHGDLTVKEIVRIVDPHQPDANPGEFRYGSDGLDWNDLSAGFRL